MDTLQPFFHHPRIQHPTTTTVQPPPFCFGFSPSRRPVDVCFSEWLHAAGMFVMMLGSLTVFTQSCVCDCRHREHTLTLKESSTSFYGQMEIGMNDCIMWSRPHLVHQFARKAPRTHVLLTLNSHAYSTKTIKANSAKRKSTGTRGNLQLSWLRGVRGDVLNLSSVKEGQPSSETSTEEAS